MIELMTISFLVFLQSCRTVPTVKRVEYDGYSINIASPQEVMRACYTPGAKWDDGTLVDPIKETYAGCYIPTKHEIWVRWDEKGAKALPHELCHKDGHHDCEKYNWPD